MIANYFTIIREVIAIQNNFILIYHPKTVADIVAVVVVDDVAAVADVVEVVDVAAAAVVVEVVAVVVEIVVVGTVVVPEQCYNFWPKFRAPNSFDRKFRFQSPSDDGDEIYLSFYRSNEKTQWFFAFIISLISFCVFYDLRLSQHPEDRQLQKTCTWF